VHVKAHLDLVAEHEAAEVPQARDEGQDARPRGVVERALKHVGCRRLRQRVSEQANDQAPAALRE
jgi:hypothetical protein